MDSMMRSLAQLLIDNAPAKFGLTTEDVELILNPQQAGDTDAHRRTITLRHLRTIEADDSDVAVGNLSVVWDGEIDNFLTIFEILVTCRPLAANRDRDYYPNEARRLADKVRGFFRGGQGAGRIVDRTAWADDGTVIGVQGNGVVHYPPRIDSQPEVPDDPARTIVLTYEMTWWAPAPI